MALDSTGEYSGSIDRSLPRLQHLRKIRSLRGSKQAALSAVPSGKKIAAAITSNALFWNTIPFWIPQIAFWILGIAGIGLDSIPVLSSLKVGYGLFFISWLLIAVIGIGSMLYAIMTLTLRGIDNFGGLKGLIFILCLTGYLVIFLNFFPWIILWLWAVTLLQKDEHGTE